MLQNRWKTLLTWSFLPFGVGLLFFAFVQLFFPRVPPILTSVDFGIAAFVVGLTLRAPGVFAFLFGFFAALICLGIYYWDRRRRWEAQSLYADYVQATAQKRRHFLRRLDHEIKNPLTGIRAALVNLKEEKTEEERQRAVGNADRAVERLTRLLTDLRKLSDLEDRAIEHFPVNVPELLDDVVTAARTIPAYEGRNITLLIPKIPSPFPMVTGDRDLLVLAVYNLVENALKFTSVEDSIEVRALEDGRAILLEVADSGVGIPSDDISKIFEELYRGSNARGTEGSGLGLALVHRIAVLHGGGIGVRSSQTQPRGTVFTVRLPRR